jgi:FMN phosphatase YigB (HAD superfamily)
MRPTTELATVLFDLGGVLTSDPWQSILLTPGDGLVDQLRLSRPEVENAAAALWPKYSLARHEETEYWAELGDVLGVTFDLEQVARAEVSTVRGNPQLPAVLSVLRGRGTAWGTVSDNTPFWHALQCELLDVRTADHEFLSFAHGAAKVGTTPDLFQLAAAVLDPAATLVVDDRDHNLAAAAAAGFRVAKYEMSADRRGSGLLDLIGGL